MITSEQSIQLTQRQLDDLHTYDVSIPTGPRLNRIWKYHWGKKNDLRHTQVAVVISVDSEVVTYRWFEPIIVKEPVHKIVDIAYLNEKPPWK